MKGPPLDKRIEAAIAMLTCLEQRLTDQRVEIEDLRQETALRRRRDSIRALVRKVLKQQ